MPPLELVAEAALIPAAGQGEHAFEHMRAKLALIGDVVDGVDGFDVLQVLPPCLVVFEIEHRGRGLPVVAVNDLRHEVELRQQVDDRAAEECEALRVVIVAVELRTVEKPVVLHEPDRDAVPVAAVESAGVGAGPQIDGVVPRLGQRLAEALAHALIQRRDDGDLVARLLQRGRQGKRDVRQPSGFAERRALAGDE